MFSLFCLIILLSQAFTRSCNIEQAHITYGDYFQVQNQGIHAYTVSVVTRDKCKESDLKLQLNGGLVLAPALATHYKNTEKNYKASAFFFKIPLANLKDTWTVLGPENTLGPYPFPRIQLSKDFSPSKYIFIADMDHSDYSEKTFDLLKQLTKENWDGIIHNGDFAYNVHSKHGKKGDEFFRKFSPISSKIPYLVSGGNHEEKFDHSNMFSYRFLMPGGDAGDSNRASHYYSFINKGVYFVTVNWDYVFRTDEDNVQKVFDWLKADLEAVSKRTDIHYKIFYSHKPFYCTFVDKDCLNFFDYKPFEALLYKFKIDLILNSHIHLYYRYKKIGQFFNILDDSAETPQMFVSGHQGVDPEVGGNKAKVKKSRQGLLENKALAGADPTILLLQIEASSLTITLRSTADYSVVDELTIQPHQRNQAYYKMV